MAIPYIGMPSTGVGDVLITGDGKQSAIDLPGLRSKRRQ
jgi:hypothetical protein